MDPTAALEGARMAADQLAALLDVDEHDGSTGGDEAVQNAAENLLTNFRSLDDWLSQGGFLPEPWQRTQSGIEHRHEYRGQALVHTHPHDGPHGYFEHPEDAHWGSLAPGYGTDTPYTDLSR